VAFNSLSRDHKKMRAAPAYSLPAAILSTPSLGITGGSDDHRGVHGSVG